MKAAPEDQLKLLTLQEHDVHVRQLRHARNQNDAQADLDAARAELSALAATLIERQGAREDAQKQLERLESDVKTVTERIARDTDLIDHSSNAKDVAGLSHELETLKLRQGSLEDAELELMQSLEDADKALSLVADERAALQGRIAELEAGIAAHLAEVDEAIASEEQARAATAAEIPEELLALYEKQRERYGLGASLLQAKVTSASGVQLTPTELDVIRHAAADEVIICPDSSAILIRTNESGL